MMASNPRRGDQIVDVSAAPQALIAEIGKD
jgi:hypothetical protein